MYWNLQVLGSILRYVRIKSSLFRCRSVRWRPNKEKRLSTFARKSYLHRLDCAVLRLGKGATQALIRADRAIAMLRIIRERSGAGCSGPSLALTIVFIATGPRRLGFSSRSRVQPNPMGLERWEKSLTATDRISRAVVLRRPGRLENCFWLMKILRDYRVTLVRIIRPVLFAVGASHQEEVDARTVRTGLHRRIDRLLAKTFAQ